MAAEPEVELIRALADDLALEILAFYKPEDFEEADFSNLGRALAYLTEHGEAPGPALQRLMDKVEELTGTAG